MPAHLVNRKVSEINMARITSLVRPPPPSFVFYTLTLSPRLYKHQAQAQWRMTIKRIVAVLQTFTLDYCLVTELTEKGNVHYHFWVHFEERIQKLKLNDVIKSISYFGYMMESKQNVNKSILQQQTDVHEYMAKSLRETYTIIRSSNIVCNYMNMPTELVEQCIDTSALDNN